MPSLPLCHAPGLCLPATAHRLPSPPSRASSPPCRVGIAVIALLLFLGMLFALLCVLDSAQPEYKQNLEDMMRPISEALQPVKQALQPLAQALQPVAQALQPAQERLAKLVTRLVKGNGAADDAEL